MSKVLRMITRARRELEGKSTWKDALMEKIDDIIYYRPDWYYKVRAFLHNLPKFIALAWNYRSWDSVYSVNVFIELLEDNALSCKNGHCTRSERLYRRGMTAAGLLHKAYDYNLCDDKASMYLHKKYPYKLESGKGFLRGFEKGSIPDKMDAIADKRIARLSKSLKKEAWEYVNKYVDHLWD